MTLRQPRKNTGNRHHPNRKPFTPRPLTIIDLQDPEWVEIEVRYNERFLSEFKRIVPVGHRKWDPKTKRWALLKSYLNTILLLIGEVFPGEIPASVVEKDSPTASKARDLSTTVADLTSELANELALKQSPEDLFL